MSLTRSKIDLVQQEVGDDDCRLVEHSVFIPFISHADGALVVSKKQKSLMEILMRERGQRERGERER